MSFITESTRPDGVLRFKTKGEARAFSEGYQVAQISLASAQRTHARLRLQCLEAECTEDEAVAHQNVADGLIETVNAAYPDNRRMPGERAASRKALFTVLAESLSEVTGGIYSVSHLIALYNAKVG